MTIAQLKLSDVSLSAASGSEVLLQELSFELASAEMVGLVGPSGAGKTSLLRLLNRLQDPTSGRIEFQGRSLSEFPVISLRRQIMMVSQESRLLNMTVAAALEYPLHLQGLPLSQVQARVRDWIDRLKIPSDWLPRRELELSVGQRQRVAIARALVTEPTLLLLDEPTSAQDLGAATRLMEHLREAATQRQLTVLMSNHQLELVQEYCDRVLFLEQGRLLGNWPIQSVDWAALRTRIVHGNEQAQAEWGAFE